ncbi:hypothetical protein A2U01_0090788, partial [Trifolium medium]|nr:hypothetical protein [Trifolium medium]
MLLLASAQGAPGCYARRDRSIYIAESVLCSRSKESERVFSRFFVTNTYLGFKGVSL